MIALPPLPAEMDLLRRVLPSLAACCDQHSLAFNGTVEGYGPLSALLLFTDHSLSSPSHGATFAVPLPATAEHIEARLVATRAQFSQSKIVPVEKRCGTMSSDSVQNPKSKIQNPLPAISSWGGPEGFDSGSDYAKN